AREQSLFTVGGDVHRESLPRELITQAFTQRRFVFDDQGPHQRVLPVSASTRTVITRPSSESSFNTYTFRPSSSCTSVRTTLAWYCASARRTASSSEMPSRYTTNTS